MRLSRIVIAGFAGLVAAASAPVPARSNSPAPADEVVVDKSDREMYLLRDGRIIARVPIALGFAPDGHKRQEGDGRTPEGRYVLDWRNPNSKFYRSIHVSYPSADDRADAARRGVPPGGEIFIHGTPPGTEFAQVDWTEGCIAVPNRAMDLIWNRVPDGTPILIRP